MNTIRFADPLVSKVLSGEKTTTWRLWDDKDLKTGDEVLFVRGLEKTPFAKAKLIMVTDKKFGEITDEDCIGHETYEKDRYEVYSAYYNREVLPDTPIKIVRFILLEKF